MPSSDPVVTDARARQCALAELNAELAAIGAAATQARIVTPELLVAVARAFTENEAIGVLARRVVDRELVFE